MVARPRDRSGRVLLRVGSIQQHRQVCERDLPSVRLDQTESELTFAVADDGIGFDTAEVGLGSGIRGMADRLDTIGGVLNFTSHIGGGTIIRGTLSLEALDSVSERLPFSVG